MTQILMRGAGDVVLLVAIAPRAKHVTQRLPLFGQRSFRFHLPRRIADSQACYSSLKTSRQLPSTNVNAPCQQSITSRRQVKRTLSSSRVPWPATLQTLTIDGLGLLSQLRSRTLRNWLLPGSSCSAWRGIHTSSVQRDKMEQRGAGNVKHDGTEGSKVPSTGDQASRSPPQDQHHQSFYDRLHMPQFHRPTKEELLGAATGFWSRLRVRFKWLTIKSVRPYNMDEIVGFLSWIALGHIIWIVIGTTTFVSLAILAINTVFAQETLAGWIGNYLTKSSGLHVVFESAIVPKWRDGVITFKNVFVSRRPGQTKSKVRKGSPEAAAQAASAEDDVPPEEQNYTQFDITIGEVNVTLSFNKWWNSKGPLEDVEIKHIRGVVDRTHVFSTGEVIDPKSYRHEHNPGDFEIESFKIEDLLLTVLQPEGFRPFPVSIYNADLPRLRKQWLFYDFLSANNITGEFDNSLFTIHPRQTHSYTGAQLNDPENPSNEPWKKQSRIRIDGLNIDHINRGAGGPLSWIHEGNVDIVTDMMIPNDTDESVMKVMADFYDRLEHTLTSRKLDLQHQGEDDVENEPIPLASGGVVLPTPASLMVREDDKRFLVMDLRIHLNDVRAVVPLFTRDLSYINNALIRPIVAYINSRRTFIPINCRVVKRMSDFDGSWTVFDSGLMDDLSAEVYDAFARDVTDEQARLRRFKKVGLWSLQIAVQAIFLGMAGNIA